MGRMGHKAYVLDYYLYNLAKFFSQKQRFFQLFFPHFAFILQKVKETVHFRKLYIFKLVLNGILASTDQNAKWLRTTKGVLLLVFSLYVL